MTKPTRVSVAVSVINSLTTPKTISGVAVQAGDIVVVRTGSENGNSTAGVPTSTGYSFAEVGTAGTGGSEARAGMWWAVAPSAATISVSQTMSGGGQWGFAVSVWRDHNGIGSSPFAGDSNTVTSSPSGVVVTGSPDSAIENVVVDWNASSTAPDYKDLVTAAVQDGGGVSSGIYSVWFWHNPDAGAAGSKTVGIDTPTMRWAMVSLEIRGVASGSSGSATEQVNLTDSVTGTRTSRGTSSEQVTISETAAGSRMSFGGAVDSIDFADSAMGSAPGLGQNLGGAIETVSYTESVTGSRVSRGSASDLVSLTDAVAGSRSALGSVTEQVNFSETAVGEFAPFGFAAETVEFIDSAAGPDPGKTVYLGSQQIKNIYLGDQVILHRYKGEDQVF